MRQGPTSFSLVAHLGAVAYCHGAWPQRWTRKGWLPSGTTHDSRLGCVGRSRGHSVVIWSFRHAAENNTELNTRLDDLELRELHLNRRLFILGAMDMSINLWSTLVECMRTQEHACMVHDQSLFRLEETTGQTNEKKRVNAWCYMFKKRGTTTFFFIIKIKY